MCWPSAWVLDKQSRAGHAFQFAHLRCLFCSRRHRLLEHAFLERAEKFPRDRELRFLRRVEPSIRRAALFHDGNGFLAWQTNGQGQGTPFAPRLAGCQRLHEPEHAGVFQIRELSAGKFSVAARAPRHHLSATASRHSSARRHFLLHVSFSFLHARHLSRRFEADQVVARFRPGRFLFSSAGRRANCAGGRFSSATCQAAELCARASFSGDYCS